VGIVGQRILIRCGKAVVRLGPVPMSGWISDAVPLMVACQRVTRITIPTHPPPSWPIVQTQVVAKASSSRFLPREL
jgi:hypothetical protein